MGYSPQWSSAAKTETSWLPPSSVSCTKTLVCFIHLCSRLYLFIFLLPQWPVLKLKLWFIAFNHRRLRNVPRQSRLLSAWTQTHPRQETTHKNLPENHPPLHSGFSECCVSWHCAVNEWQTNGTLNWFSIKCIHQYMSWIANTKMKKKLKHRNVLFNQQDKVL